MLDKLPITHIILHLQWRYSQCWGDCPYFPIICQTQVFQGGKKKRLYGESGINRVSSMRFCTVFLQPVFLPQGVALNNWCLRRTARGRGVRSQDFEILLLRSPLGIHWKSHILGILQEKIAIWPNNKINIFTEIFILSNKSTYNFFNYRFSHVLWLTVCACPAYCTCLFPEKNRKDFSIHC